MILTGIGRDGIQYMPKSAFEAGAVDKQLPLSAIAGAIMNRVKGRDFR